jgi:phage host-nuclease inhibitor protein Gam
MSEPTNQDLKELLLAFEKKVDLSLSDMNRRMEVGFAELNRKIDVGLAEVRTEIAEVRGEIKRVEEKLTGEITRVDEKLTGEIKRLDTEIKSVEANLSAKLDGLGKRVENQEFVSRGATVALVGGLVTGMVKLLFFPDRLP